MTKVRLSRIDDESDLVLLLLHEEKSHLCFDGRAEREHSSVEQLPQETLQPAGRASKALVPERPRHAVVKQRLLQFLRGLLEHHRSSQELGSSRWEESLRPLRARGGVEDLESLGIVGGQVLRLLRVQVLGPHKLPKGS